MQSQLDLAITAAAAAEATYQADLDNVSSIQTAIATATAPLVPAQAKAQTDGADFKQKLLDLATQATNAAMAIPDVTPPPTGN